MARKKRSAVSGVCREIPILNPFLKKSNVVFCRGNVFYHGKLANYVVVVGLTKNHWRRRCGDCQW